MRSRLINAFAWLLTQLEEVLAASWSWIDALEHQQRVRALTDEAVEQVADEEPGDYTVVVSEQTVFEITKHEVSNAVHLPRKRLN